MLEGHGFQSPSHTWPHSILDLFLVSSHRSRLPGSLRTLGHTGMTRPLCLCLSLGLSNPYIGTALSTYQKLCFLSIILQECRTGCGRWEEVRYMSSWQGFS